MPTWTLKTGEVVTIRAIAPEDEPLLVEFHQTLSEESVFLRYAHMIKLSQRIRHDRLHRICHPTPDESVWVAVYGPPTTPEIVAVARLNQIPETEEAEFALLVSDRFQHRGLGTRLLQHLVEVARQHQFVRIFGEILPENHDMEHVCQALGFHVQFDLETGFVLAELNLDPA